MPDRGTHAETTGNAHWYRGQVRDGSTGNYQLGTRTYDPGTGAFTTPDTYRVATPSTDLSVGTDPLTANTYTYVNGNPLNYTDPDGHRPACLEDRQCNVRSNGTGGIRVIPISATERVERASATVRAEESGLDENRSRASELQGQVDAGVDWGEVFGGLAADLSGLTDAKACADFDAWGCINTAINFLPVGKAFKLATNTVKYVKRFLRIKKALSRAGDELSAPYAASSPEVPPDSPTPAPL